MGGVRMPLRQGSPRFGISPAKRSFAGHVVASAGRAQGPMIVNKTDVDDMG